MLNDIFHNIVEDAVNIIVADQDIKNESALKYINIVVASMVIDAMKERLASMEEVIAEDVADTFLVNLFA